HVLREVELRIEREVLVFVAWADDFNHGLGDHSEGIVLIGRLGAEDGDVGTLKRSVLELYLYVGVMEASASNCAGAILSRFNRRPYEVNHLLVAKARKSFQGGDARR